MKLIKVTQLKFSSNRKVIGSTDLFINTATIHNFHRIEKKELTEFIYKNTGLTASTIYINESPETLIYLITKGTNL